MVDHADDPDAELPSPAGVARRLFEPDHTIDYFPTREMLYLAEDCVTSCTDLAAGRTRIVGRPGDERAAYVASHLFFTLPLLDGLARRAVPPLGSVGARALHRISTSTERNGHRMSAYSSRWAAR